MSSCVVQEEVFNYIHNILSIPGHSAEEKQSVWKKAMDHIEVLIQHYFWNFPSWMDTFPINFMLTEEWQVSHYCINLLEDQKSFSHLGRSHVSI